jgi:hypothetical protein
MEDDDSDAEMADYGTDFSDDAEQLARMERDWAARTTALGTADAAKWVNRRRQEHCSTQPRATISMSRTPGRCQCLREVGHGRSRAAPGAPPPLETPKSGR